MNFRCLSLFDLLTLHGRVRGDIVNTREEAMEEGTIFDVEMLYRYDEVLSSFI